MDAVGVGSTDLGPFDLGSGLILVPTTADDAREAYDVVVVERERLREWLPWIDATTSVDVERDFLVTLERANALGEGAHLTIRLDGEFCGLVGLRLDQFHRNAAVGYWLAARGTGRGVMTRSVAILIDYGFTMLSLHRVELLAATENLRSRAVAQRLGLSFEGIRREAEELPRGFVDLAMYAVLARDWPGAATALERAAATR
jgi:ribosomal-protein-serine acetyltransferase